MFHFPDLTPLFYLALIGIVSIAGAGVFALYEIFQHVSITLH